MKYELKKSISNKIIIMILLILLCVNGLELYYHCKYYKMTTPDEKEYTTKDYQNFTIKASESIKAGQDVFLSKLVITEFIDREISVDAYKTVAAEFVSYEKSAMYGLIMMALIVIFTIDTERKSGMSQIISISGGREGKVFLTKQAVIAINSVVINFLFLLENIIVCKLYGELDLGVKLYNVPGYFATWFSENILLYKILCTVGVAMVQIIAGNLIYMLACLFRNVIPLMAVSFIVGIAGIYIGNAIPVKYCYINPFSFFNCAELSKDFIPVKIGAAYTYRLWVALVILIILMLVVNICNYLMYRDRRMV